MVLTRSAARANEIPPAPQIVIAFGFGMHHATALFLAAAIAMLGGFKELGLSFLALALATHFLGGWLS